MAEYIERDVLLKNAQSVFEFRKEHYMDTKDIESLIRYLEWVSAADVVEVVHGRWVQVICHVEFEDGFVDRLYECCSRCHTPNGRKTSDYCPNCGARMRGAEDE